MLQPRTTAQPQSRLPRCPTADRRPPSRHDAELRKLATFLGSSAPPPFSESTPFSGHGQVRGRHSDDSRAAHSLSPLPPIPAVGVTQYFPSLELGIPHPAPNTTRTGVGLSKPLCERRIEGCCGGALPSHTTSAWPVPTTISRFRQTLPGPASTITRPPPAGTCVRVRVDMWQLTSHHDQQRCQLAGLKAWLLESVSAS